MKDFKVKEFVAPAGVPLDSDTQKLFGAMQGWLQETFAEFAASEKSAEDYAKDISEKLEKAGFSVESLSQIEKALKAQGETLEKMRMGGTGASMSQNPIRKAIMDNHDMIVKLFLNILRLSSKCL